MTSPAEVIMQMMRLKADKNRQAERLKAGQHSQIMSSVLSLGQTGLRMKQQSDMQASAQEQQSALQAQAQEFSGVQGELNREQQSGLQEALLGFKGSQADKNRLLAEQRIKIHGTNVASMIETRDKDFALRGKGLDQRATLAREAMSQDWNKFQGGLAQRNAEIDKRYKQDKMLARLKAQLQYAGDKQGYENAVKLIDKRGDVELEMRKELASAEADYAAKAAGQAGLGKAVNASMLSGLVRMLTSGEEGDVAPFLASKVDPEVVKRKASLLRLLDFYTAEMSADLEERGKFRDARELESSMKTLLQGR